MEVHVKQVENNHVLEKLQKKYFHIHDNAFKGLWFGEISEGILVHWSNTCISTCIIPYVIKQLFESHN